MELMDALSFRPATLEDSRLLGAMNLRLIRDEGHRNPMSEEELARRMEGWLHSGEYRAVVFEEKGMPVGYALFRTEAEGVYLRQFFIEQPERRRGLGRSAMELLRRSVFPQNCRITLEVLCGNEGGRRFWEAVGFREYAVTMEMQN